MLLGIIGVQRDPLAGVDNNRFLFNIALSIATWRLATLTRIYITEIYATTACKFDYNCKPM